MSERPPPAANRSPRAKALSQVSASPRPQRKARSPLRVFSSARAYLPGARPDTFARKSISPGSMCLARPAFQTPGCLIGTCGLASDWRSMALSPYKQFATRYQHSRVSLWSPVGRQGLEACSLGGTLYACSIATPYGRAIAQSHGRARATCTRRARRCPPAAQTLHGTTAGGASPLLHANMIEYTRRAECPLGAPTPHSDYPLLAIRQLTFDLRRWPRTTARRLPAVVRRSPVLRVDIDGVTPGPGHDPSKVGGSSLTLPTLLVLELHAGTAPPPTGDARNSSRAGRAARALALLSPSAPSDLLGILNPVLSHSYPSLSLPPPSRTPGTPSPLPPSAPSHPPRLEKTHANAAATTIGPRTTVLAAPSPRAARTPRPRILLLAARTVLALAPAGSSPASYDILAPGSWAARLQRAAPRRAWPAPRLQARTPCCSGPGTQACTARLRHPVPECGAPRACRGPALWERGALVSPSL
ncbi:hypothetical protein AcV5_010361 [Taiwanofungus camphoratus]|nr:hypothetical protein AcV5_010361 [Antrodia cinnamomea]